MKNLCSILLLLGLCACSEKVTQSKHPAGHPASTPRSYSVTFATVKIPDSTLSRLALPAYEEPSTIASRRKLAAYVSAHPADVSVWAPAGNIVPLVWNNERLEVKVLLDSAQEAKDLATFGMATTQFNPGVSLRETDDKGEAYCNWSCGCSVHLKQPAGNSIDQGRGGGCGSGMAVIGQPEIWPLCRGNGVSLWMLATLNRP
jgi:hypothetical protein